MRDSTTIVPLQNPNAMTLTPAQLAALAALNESEEMAPPPSKEEVFGAQLEEINNQFQEDQVMKK